MSALPPPAATCHVPEVRLSSPFARRAPRTANASSSRRPSGGGRPRSSRGSRGTGGSAPALAAAMPPEVLWTVPETGMPSFAELGLPAPVLRALAAGGFTAPFPIQAATLPETLAGRDLLGRGQTGSGKTLAFGLALLSRLDGGRRSRAQAPRTRARAHPRARPAGRRRAGLPYAKALGLTVTSVVGGMSFNRQAAELQRGVDLLVATPGRLTDHTTQRTCDLSGGRGHRDRRGRPDGRHGLPAPGPRDPRPHPRGRAAAAVLRDARRRGRHAGRAATCTTR